MKKFIFIIFALAVIFSAGVVSVSAVPGTDGDSSQTLPLGIDTNVNTDTDTSPIGSMIPNSAGTNVPDSAVDSNSTSAPSITDEDDNTSAIIGIIIAIVAVAAVVVLVVVLIPKDKGKK